MIHGCIMIANGWQRIKQRKRELRSPPASSRCKVKMVSRLSRLMHRTSNSPGLNLPEQTFYCYQSYNRTNFLLLFHHPQRTRSFTFIRGISDYTHLSMSLLHYTTIRLVKRSNLFSHKKREGRKSKTILNETSEAESN